MGRSVIGYAKKKVTDFKKKNYKGGKRNSKRRSTIIKKKRRKEDVSDPQKEKNLFRRYFI